RWRLDEAMNTSWNACVSQEGGKLERLLPNQALFRAKPPPAGHRGYRLGRQLGIRSLRSRQRRALLTTPLLWVGVPLLLGGDESGRTQAGQQQRVLSGQRDHLVRLVRSRPRSAGVSRRLLAGAETSELRWYMPAGTAMTQADWAEPNARSLAI